MRKSLSRKIHKYKYIKREKKIHYTNFKNNQVDERGKLVLFLEILVLILHVTVYWLIHRRIS